MRKFRFKNTKDIETSAGNELLMTVDDYEIWYRIFLKDPEDEDAQEMLRDCEDYILNEPTVKHFIEEPAEFLFEFEKNIEAEFERRLECR